MNTITQEWAERALGRPSNPEPLTDALNTLRRRGLVLITGGLGSLGTAVADLFDDQHVEFLVTDEREMDVTDEVQTRAVMRMFKPATILHLAGAKHAPEGELDPMHPARVHIDGTHNVLRNAPADSRVVTASTCKACDPETVYGASKLVAERMTLNAGHTVARFHNVVETSGNVFHIWKRQDGVIPVAGCDRYFITVEEAVSVLVYAAAAQPGRYAIDPGARHEMHEIAHRLYPTRDLQLVPPRRGDRTTEPLVALSEAADLVTDRVLRITSPHDPVLHTSYEVAA